MSGAFLYEYWVVNCVESHDGSIYGLQVRALSSPTWTDYLSRPVNYPGASTNQPSKTNTNPHSAQVKQYALDSVKIDRATGALTTLASNVDFAWADYDPTAAAGTLLREGLPSISSSSPVTHQHRVTDDGTVSLLSPLLNEGAILIFDSWKQQANNKYRIQPTHLSTSGSPNQWTWTSAGGSAVFAYNASAATIQTALAALTDVASVTVTGGPLPLSPVDIDLTWTTSTGRFTAMGIVNVARSGSRLYDYSAGKFAGRNLISGGAGFVTSDNAAVVTGNLTRHTIGSDSFGVVISSTPVVTVTAITTAGRTPACSGMTIAPAVGRVKHGKVIVGVNRSILGGVAQTSAVRDEITLASIGNQDSLMDSNTAFFADSSNIASWGIDDCGLRMTGGEQYNSLPASGGIASSSWMLGGGPVGFTPTKGIIVGFGSNVVGSTTDGSPVADTNAVLSDTLTISQTLTSITGGDAFFPTTSYTRQTVNFSSPPLLYKDNTEWRILLLSGGTTIKSTAWFDYYASDADVQTELDLWYGNNSAGLPNIVQPFATTDNAVTPLMWFQKPQTIYCVTASEPNRTTYSLMLAGLVFRIEVRTANFRTQRAIACINLSDSVVDWQRNFGTAYGSLGTPAANVTLDDDVIVGYGGTWRSGNHPAITSGPL
jgi:hypothetical protein